MSVLMITPWYGMEERGGVAVAVQNLVCGLRSIGLRTLVLVLVGDGWLPRYEKGSSGEHIFRLPLRARSESRGRLKAWLGYWLRLPAAWLLVSFLLIGAQCRIVHFHYCTEEYNDLRKIVRRLRRRIVATFHGSDIAFGADEESIGAAIRGLVGDSVRVTTCSRDLLDQLLRKVPESSAKGITILNTAHPTFIKAAEEFNYPQVTDIDVLYVGALRFVKGPDVLLEAFVEVLKFKPNARLCIIGTGDMEDALRRTIEGQRLEANVELLGSIPHSVLVQYYARAKMVAMPSRSEGLALVAIEAAIMGKPVVATDVGGLPEVVAENESGLVVPSNNPAALSGAILTLLQDDELSTKLGSQAKNRALNLFNQPRMAATFVQLYRDATLS